MNIEAQNHQLRLEIEALQEKIASLKESEERYRLISSVATDYTFSTKVMTDGSLNLNWVAGAFESISGYSFEEFKARGGWRATIHPDDYPIDDKDLARLRNNLSTESQIRTINRDGKIVWVQVFAHPLWSNEKNRLVGIYGAVKNITDRKNAEENLIKSELQFRSLVENIHEMVTILNFQEKPTYTSPAVERITGFSLEELQQMDGFCLIHPDELEDAKKTFEFLKNNPGVQTTRINRLLHKDGHWIWAEGTLINLINNENINAIVSNYRDITERLTLEKHLKDYNERLKLILENAPIAIWDWNLETDQWYATSKYYTMLGYEPETGYPDRTTWLNRTHPDDRNVVEKKITAILYHENEEYSYEARMLHSDGSYRWQAVIGNAIERNKENKLIRMLGVRIDINERKLAEELVMNSEKRLRDFLEKINLIAVILDINGKVIFCNDYLLNLTGYSSAEMIGADWFDLMIPNDHPDVKKMFLNSLKEGKILSRIENPIVTKDGRIRDIVWSNTVQHDSNGHISGASSIGEDITDQKLAKEAILSKDRLLHLTGEMAKVGGWEFETKTMKGKWTNEVAKIHALDPEFESNVALGLSFYDSESRLSIENAVDRAISNKESYDLTLKMTDANGVKKWVRTIGIPVVEEGKVVRLQGTFQDISELKKAEDDLRLLNAELEQRVLDRTKELETSNTELARMNRLFVGRELRMVELKRQIKELEEKHQTNNS